MGFAPERRGERCIHVGSWYRYTDTGTSKDFWAKFLAFFLLTPRIFAKIAVLDTAGNKETPGLFHFNCMFG
jgi:hypothetical protein